MAGERVIVFDGYCHVCSGGVRLVLRHRVEPPYEMVPMQSERGRALLAAHGIDPEDPVTFLVLDGGRAMTESDGCLHVAAGLGGLWKLAQACRVLPKPWRDGMYRVLARNRYSWFGKRDTCYLP